MSLISIKKKNLIFHDDPCIEHNIYCKVKRGQTYYAGSVEVFGILGDFVKGQEAISISSGSMTEAVALLQQTSLPDHLPTLQGVLQILPHSKHLGRKMAYSDFCSGHKHQVFSRLLHACWCVMLFTHT